MKTITQIASNKYTVNITLVFLSDQLLLGDDVGDDAVGDDAVDDGSLQLFQVQQLLEKLKDNPTGEEGHEGICSLMMSQLEPVAPHPLK